jgi:branched-chain amino acid transport system permease protein
MSVLVLIGAGLCLPLFGDSYLGVIGTRACIYWVLVSGLNLVVGFAGQIAIGWVALLTLGAYVTSVLTAGTAVPELSPYIALAIAAFFGAIFGVIVGLPALRLRTFYFAMTTLGFADRDAKNSVGLEERDGRRPACLGRLPGRFRPREDSISSPGFAVICTWMTTNIAASHFGSRWWQSGTQKSLQSRRHFKPALLVTVFLFSGALAGIAGGLFASLQSYITPDAFTFDLSVLFFIAILIGGRGSILGPLLGTIILTALPEFAAPLVAWSTFLYATLLLAIVLIVPGGIAEMLDFKNRRPLEQHRQIRPRPELLQRVMGESAPPGFRSKNVSLNFGGVRAIDSLSLEIARAKCRLIGPNGSGKTTTLNAISGYYAPQHGQIALNGRALPPRAPHRRAGYRIARTFQTPRLVGEESVLENVMLGGTTDGRSRFVDSLFALPRHRRDEAMLSEAATAALAVVGLEQLAHARSDRLQHSELRFVEIARALMLRPSFLLLDEPAAGLSVEEIKRLGDLIVTISRRGTGVLLVEHHADLIFDICDRVTVLNLGKELASGTPAEIRAHREVINAYLGA